MMARQMQPDVFRPRCYGLPPGAPCPAPENCDCNQGDIMRGYSGPLTWPVVIIVMLFIVGIFLAIWGLTNIAYGADNVARCLTKEQARAKWPKEWIYWHGSNHCWDNVRGTANTATAANGSVKIIRAPKPNRAAKEGRADTQPALDANGNPAGLPIIRPTQPSIVYPSLMPGIWIGDDMLRPDGMSSWPVLIDIDDPPLFVPWQKRISFLSAG